MSDADAIWSGGRIYTVDTGQPWATAVAIRDGRIVAVGSDGDMAAWRGRATRDFDLAGHFLMPGFIDSHVHINPGGRYLRGVALRDARSVAEVQQRIAVYAAAHPDDRWILGEAWSYGYPDMPNGAPTSAMIDAVVSDRPVLLQSMMAHASWANRMALDVAGITASTPDPDGGFIMRDAQGVPTGWLKGSAGRMVSACIPPESDGEVRANLLAAMKEAARLGITRLVSCGGDWRMLSMLAELEASGGLTARFSISEWVTPATLDDAVIAKVQQGVSAYRSDWITAGAVKFFADGVIESHTAFLPCGYHDKPHERGISIWTAEEQSAAMRRLAAEGLQIYTHAIGDGAISQTLDVYAEIRADHPDADLRNRIEHYEAPYAADIGRLADLDVIASVQPVMIYPKEQWIGMEGVWQAHAGDDRMSRAFPLRSVIDSGGTLAFGTDWPVVDLDPRLGLRNAVVRQSRDGEPVGGWVPHECIDVHQAIRAYTLDAAYSAFRDHAEGRICVGNLADFVIFAEDLTIVPPDELAAVAVLATIVGGQVVFEAA